MLVMLTQVIPCLPGFTHTTAHCEDSPSSPVCWAVQLHVFINGNLEWEWESMNWLFIVRCKSIQWTRCSVWLPIALQVTLGLSWPFYLQRRSAISKHGAIYMVLGYVVHVVVTFSTGTCILCDRLSWMKCFFICTGERLMRQTFALFIISVTTVFVNILLFIQMVIIPSFHISKVKDSTGV